VTIAFRGGILITLPDDALRIAPVARAFNCWTDLFITRVGFYLPGVTDR
jgi:hypothetical protein